MSQDISACCETPRACSAAQRWYPFVVLGALLALLSAALPFARASSYRGTHEFHATIEMTGALIALLAGMCFIARFYSLGNRFFLLVGLAFFVNGVKDSVHGVLSLAESRHWMLLSESSFEQAIPATGVSGRILMALLLIAAVLLPPRMGKPRSPKRETFWGSGLALLATGLATWVIFLVPLPRFDFPAQVISRPVDFASAVLFAIALAMFLRMYHRTRDLLVWGLALSVGISLVVQGIMGFSKQLGDACYDIAHIYKVLSYAVPVLAFAIYQTSTILEVRRMERLLAQEKDRLSVTLRSIGDAVIATDVEGRIALVNGVAERLTGWHESDAVRKPLGEVFRIINEKTRQPCEDPVAKVLRSGAAVDLANHTALLARDGTERKIADSGAPIHDAAGNVVGVVLVFRDVTRERQAEEARLAAAAYARSLIEASLDPLVTISAEGQITDVNTATELATGASREELLGTKFSSYFTEPEKARVGYQEVFAQGSVNDYPLSIRHKSGRVIDVLYNATVYKDAAGKVAGVFAAARDITERKRAEEVLRLNETRLQALMELNQMAGASMQEITDFALESAVRLTQSTIGYLAFMNDDESVLTMHSWSKSAMQECAIIDKPIVYQVVNTGLWGEAVRQRKPVITNDYQAPNPQKKGHPAGHVKVLRHMNAPVFDGERIVIVAGVGNKEDLYNDSDVTQLTLLMQGMWQLIVRKRAAEAITRYNAQLEEANRELEAFSYSVSHDLRTPLRSLDGFSLALLVDYGDGLSAEAKDHLARIRAASQRMGILIDDLLKLSRITRQELTRRRVDLSRLARLIEQELRSLEPQREVEFVVADNVSGEGDEPLLRIMLQKLLENAWKFTGRQPQARIEFGQDSSDGRTVYFVRDNGVGFEMEYSDKLFAAFQRLHTAAEFPGTGIGLATVQRIIHRHGGRVWADAAPGHGATFYFTL